MCLVIEPDCILANLFFAGRKSVTMGDLAQIRRKLERARGGIFIDVAASSVRSAIEHRADMFRWDGASIVMNEADDLLCEEYVDSFFNWQIPEDVVEIVRSCA